MRHSFKNSYKNQRKTAIAFHKGVPPITFCRNKLQYLLVKAFSVESLRY